MGHKIGGWLAKQNSGRKVVIYFPEREKRTPRSQELGKEKGRTIKKQGPKCRRFERGGGSYFSHRSYQHLLKKRGA